MKIKSLRAAQMEEFYPNIFPKLSNFQLAVFGALFRSLMVTGGQSTGVCASQKQYLFHLRCLMAHIYSKFGAVFRYSLMKKPNVIRVVPVKQKVSLGFRYRQVEIINTCSQLRASFHYSVREPGVNPDGMHCLSSRVYFFLHRTALKWQRVAAALISSRSFALLQLCNFKTSDVISDGCLVLFPFFNIAEHFRHFHSIADTQVQGEIPSLKALGFYILPERSRVMFALQKPVVKVCPPFNHKIICEVAD